jgi:hypothetical protein
VVVVVVVADAAVTIKAKTTMAFMVIFNPSFFPRPINHPSKLFILTRFLGKDTITLWLRCDGKEL